MKNYILIFSIFLNLNNQIFPQEKIYTKVNQIEEGIIHKHIIDKVDTLSIHILTIDLKNNSYSIIAIKGNDSLLGRETTSSMFKRLKEKKYKPIAALNSDFFKIKYGGEPENNLIINGEFVKGISETDSEYDLADNIHSQFGITNDNEPFIERFKFTGDIISKDRNKILINRINAQTDSNSLTLYNKYQGYATPKSKDNWKNLEIRLKKLFNKGDTLFFKVTDEWNSKGNTKINDDDFILSTNNEMIGKINSHIFINDTLKVILKLFPDVGKVITLTGGWGKLVKDGKNYVDSTEIEEEIFERFSKTKHPRSGIGFSKNKDKLFLFAIDGRQESSKGVTLKKFADIMIAEGVYEGLNFDGGGSTTLIINDKIINNPSDKTGEREVGVSIAIIKK